MGLSQLALRHGWTQANSLAGGVCQLSFLVAYPAFVFPLSSFQAQKPLGRKGRQDMLEAWDQLNARNRTPYTARIAPVRFSNGLTKRERMLLGLKFAQLKVPPLTRCYVFFMLSRRTTMLSIPDVAGITTGLAPHNGNQ